MVYSEKTTVAEELQVSEPHRLLNPTTELFPWKRVLPTNRSVFSLFPLFTAVNFFST